MTENDKLQVQFADIKFDELKPEGSLKKLMYKIAADDLYNLGRSVSLEDIEAQGLDEFITPETCAGIEDKATSFVYLEAIRRSGITNMFGSAPYLHALRPELAMRDCTKLIGQWMKLYDSTDYDNLFKNEIDLGER